MTTVALFFLSPTPAYFVFRFEVTFLLEDFLAIDVWEHYIVARRTSGETNREVGQNLILINVVMSFRPYAVRTCGALQGFYS